MSPSSLRALLLGLRAVAAAAGMHQEEDPAAQRIREALRRLDQGAPLNPKQVIELANDGVRLLPTDLAEDLADALETHSNVA